MVELSFETQQKLFNLAKKHHNDIKIAYSPSSYICRTGINHLRPILENIDVLIVNKEGAEDLVGKGEAIELAKELSTHGPTIISITQDVKGVYLYERESSKELHLTPSKKLNIKDTTGAGDAFGSGFVAGLIMGKTIKEAALMGVLNAEYAIGCVGANMGISNRKIVEGMLLDPKQYENHGLTM